MTSVIESIEAQSPVTQSFLLITHLLYARHYSKRFIILTHLVLTIHRS